MLPAFYFITLFFCVLPTLLGFVNLFLSSLSLMPSMEMANFSLKAFSDVFAWSGVYQSIGLTFISSLLSTYLATFFCFAILQSCWGSRYWKNIKLMLSPLLSIPHVAFAIGFAFLFAPTGMLVRFFLSIFTDYEFGYEQAFLVQDPYAIGLTLMLGIKEVPFLLIMSISVLNQINVDNLLKVSASMGYNIQQTWWKTIFPIWFHKMRFPFYAVLAYGISVVDVASIIGPTNPPTFSVQIWQWFNDPDLSQFPRAAAGACLMLLLAILMLSLVKFIEWLSLSCYRSWQFSGRHLPKLPGKAIFNLIALLSICIFPLMLLWSFAKRWRFPDIFPSRFSVDFWINEFDNLYSVIGQSLVIAIISATIALLMAIIAQEYRLTSKFHVPNLVIAIPMLIPQISILLGMQITALYFDVNNHFFAVIWAHVLFIFPYAYLSLDGSWKSFDQRLVQTAMSLGKTPFKSWLCVKFPILFPSVVIAWAVAISVSFAQYLPTLILGAGRIATITTEAVAISSGHDRRVIAIYALWQGILPLIFFSFAFLLNQKITRKNTNKSKGFL